MRRDGGAAPVEAIFAIFFLLFLALGTVEVAFVLYGRNVVQASAHEGARAVVELHTDPQAASTVARETIERAAGGLVQDLQVDAALRRSGTRTFVEVRVQGRLKGFGPVPVSLPVVATAVATRETLP